MCPACDPKAAGVVHDRGALCRACERAAALIAYRAGPGGELDAQDARHLAEVAAGKPALARLGAGCFSASGMFDALERVALGPRKRRRA